MFEKENQKSTAFDESQRIVDMSNVSSKQIIKFKPSGKMVEEPRLGGFALNNSQSHALLKDNAKSSVRTLKGLDESKS